MRSFAKRVEAPLGREELRLGPSSCKLTVREDHGGFGDLLRASNCSWIGARPRRAFQSTPGLLDRTFGELGILLRVERSKPRLELRVRRYGLSPLRDAGRSRQDEDERQQREAGAGYAPVTLLIDT